VIRIIMHPDFVTDVLVEDEGGALFVGKLSVAAVCGLLGEYEASFEIEVLS